MPHPMYLMPPINLTTAVVIQDLLTGAPLLVVVFPQGEEGEGVEERHQRHILNNAWMKTCEELSYIPQD